MFGEKSEHPDVIRKRVFEVIGHPIYLSELLLYFGIFGQHDSRVKDRLPNLFTGIESFVIRFFV